MLEVAALSLQPAAVSALETVLQAERDHHLRAAAFSDKPQERDMHLGIFRWIEEWLAGGILERQAEKARQKLDLLEPIDGAPEGSPYMESDGLTED
jgi:hypothetical protein